METAILKKCPLFEGISQDEMTALLDCLGAKTKDYAKDEYIFLAGDAAGPVGIVIKGLAHVIQEDFWGDRVIMAYVKPGEIFAEAFSGAGVKVMPLSVVAVEKSKIMFVEYSKISTVCSNSCAFHTRLIVNMNSILAGKNMLLTRKVGHLSKGTTRKKVLSFLSEEAVKSKSNKIEIPFNRQEMADYLSVERSALSRELSLMQKDGLISYEKNCFVLKSDCKD